MKISTVKSIILSVVATTLIQNNTWAMENTALTPKSYKKLFFAKLNPQDCEITNDDRILDDNDDSKNRCCSHWLTLPPVAETLKTLKERFSAKTLATQCLDCIEQIWRDPPEIETTVDEAAMTVEMLWIDGELLSSDDRHANLSSRNITYLPPEVGKLTALTQLSISNNLLSSLPLEFGNLTMLQLICLSRNQLTIIPSTLCNLTALRYLDISGNVLTTFPSEIGNLTALIYLDLFMNKLTSLPSDFSNLTALTYLNLANNQLTALPSEFSHLTALTDLFLNDNKLTSLPSEFGNLTALTYLELSYNKITSLPSEFSNLTALMRLNLLANPLKRIEFTWATTLKSIELKDFRLFYGKRRDFRIKATLLTLANQHDEGSALALLPQDISNYMSLLHIAISPELY